MKRNKKQGCGEMFLYNGVGLKCGEKYTVGEGASFCPKCQEESKVVPKCSNCGNSMKNAIDSKTKKVSKYLWKCDCNEMKGMVLSRG